MKNVFHISLLSATKAYLVNYINKNDLCYGEFCSTDVPYNSKFVRSHPIMFFHGWRQ